MITPLDIEEKRFSKKRMNGYSVEEVDDFLDELAIDYSKNYKEVAELSAKVEELSKSLAHYKTIEETLQSTLVMAQSTAEETKRLAKQQAEQIVKDKDQLILVYCRSGRRSKEAAVKLIDLGYTNVLDFGGIIDWPYEIE